MPPVSLSSASDTWTLANLPAAETIPAHADESGRSHERAEPTAPEDREPARAQSEAVRRPPAREEARGIRELEVEGGVRGAAELDERWLHGRRGVGSSAVGVLETARSIAVGSQMGLRTIRRRAATSGSLRRVQISLLLDRWASANPLGHGTEATTTDRNSLVVTGFVRSASPLAHSSTAICDRINGLTQDREARRRRAAEHAVVRLHDTGRASSGSGELLPIDRRDGSYSWRSPIFRRSSSGRSSVSTAPSDELLPAVACDADPSRQPSLRPLCGQ
jgi:hypothetical protein